MTRNYENENRKSLELQQENELLDKKSTKNINDKKLQKMTKIRNHKK